MPDLAVKLQTLAEKMTNTIYRAAKVCSYQSVSTDKITDISWQDIFIISSFCLSNVWDEFNTTCFNIYDDV
jgi:hypothetical protein